MTGIKMPIDFQKLKNIVKGKPAPSTFIQKKEYGDSYKSPYTKTVEAPQKRHSAPNVLVNQPTPSPTKEYVSQYSYKVQKPPEAKDKNDEKHTSQAPSSKKKRPSPPVIVIPKVEKSPLKEKRPTLPILPPPIQKPDTEQPPPTQKRPTPPTISLPTTVKPTAQPPPPPQKRPTPPKITPPTTGKPTAEPPPSTQKQPIPPKIPKQEQPAQKGPAPPKGAAPAKETTASKETPQPTSNEKGPTSQAASSPATEKPPAQQPPVKERRLTPPTVSAPTTEKPTNQQPPTTSQPTAQQPPQKQKRPSPPTLPPPKLGMQRSPSNQSINMTKPSPHTASKENLKILSSQNIPTLQTTEGLRKKPPEVSGYFVSNVQSKEKKLDNFPTKLLFSPPEIQVTTSIDEPEIITEEKPIIKQGSVKFEEKVGIKEPPPTPNKEFEEERKRRISFKDGSMHVDINKISELPALTKAFEEEIEDFEDDDFFEDDDDTDFKDYQRSSFSATPQDSLDSIRQSPLHLETETLEEYRGHRKDFLRVFSFFLFCFVSVLGLALVFIFYYNHGFKTSPTHLLTNETLYKHETSRFYLNMHMLLMITRVELFSFSSQLYRIFPWVSRTNMKYVHGFINILGALSTSGGLYSIFMGKITSGAFRMYSLHSYLGAVTTFFTSVTFLVGLPSILPCCSWETKVSLFPFHRQLAGLSLSAGSASLLTGCMQMSRIYFNPSGFPDYYDLPYHVIHWKSAVLNLTAIMVVFLSSSCLYIISNYQFRRRRAPEAKLEQDPDAIQITNIEKRRKSLAIHEEAQESGRGDDVQIGSRKSFNLVKRHTWKPSFYRDRSIPLLINDTEKRKANFTDTDLLLSLE